MQELTSATSVQTAPGIEIAGIRITEATQVEAHFAGRISTAMLVHKLAVLAGFAEITASYVSGQDEYQEWRLGRLRTEIAQIKLLVELLRDAA